MVTRCNLLGGGGRGNGTVAGEVLADPDRTEETTMSAGTGQVRLAGVGQVAVTVRDLARATAFYREVLELRYLFGIPDAAFFDCGGVRLMLSKPEREEFDHPASILYYRVAGIGEAHAALAGRGVVFEREPHLLARMPDHELWMAFFRDSEGNLLALMEEVR
jgi:methylmalonyl-CoA/ethylmalonyl-CoA epimerase